MVVDEERGLKKRSGRDLWCLRDCRCIKNPVIEKPEKSSKNPSVFGGQGGWSLSSLVIHIKHPRNVELKEN